MPMSKAGPKEIALYVLISLAVAGGAVAIGIYDADHGLTADTQMLWIAAGVFTCFVFGFSIKINLKLLRSPQAWGLLFVLLLLHGGLVIWLVQSASMRGLIRVPLMLFAVISVVEISSFGYVLQKLLKPNHRKKGDE
jgi:FtsH-binding integral membrane protein